MFVDRTLPLPNAKKDNTVWRWLTEPPYFVQDVGERRNLQLFLTLSVIFTLLVLIGGLIVTPQVSGVGYSPQALREPLTLIGIVYSLFLAILHILGHTRGYKLAMFFFSISISILASVEVALGIYTDIQALYIGFMSVVISALLLTGRDLILANALSLVGPILLMLFHPALPWQSYAPLIPLYIVGMVLLVVFTYHRDAIERDRQAELRRVNEMLEERVAERTRDLEIARDEAERANQAKSQFLASMSHELRTPLNAILSFNKLLAMGTFGPVTDEQRDYLQKSVQSGKHLLSLINDVLDITKIQSGMMQLFIEGGFSVEHEVSEIASAAEKLLGDKPVRLVLDIDRDLPLMTCDKRRVRQLLFNLISNAVKFTEEGTITVSAKRRGDTIMFAVIDTGPGIPWDQRDLLFEPFVQTESGIKHIGGTGLGLPISMQLVTAHGGRLWLESTPGEGAAFYATLPLQPEMALEEVET